jgi:hypothetical protein
MKQVESMRSLLKPILLLTLVFTVCIGLIRAQSHDDTQLRAFLIPSDGCPLPCFIGIRPGVTTPAEAAAILETHEWVRDAMVYYDRTGHIYLIQWAWNESASDLVDRSKLAYLYARADVVQSISTPTTIPLADIWLAFGKPDRGDAGSSGQRPASTFFQNVGYLNGSLGVQSMISCPVTLRAVFQTPVSVIFFADMEARFGHEDFRLSDWVRIRPCDANGI